MDTSALEDLGLTNAEIKVYLALLQIGSTAAGKVIEKSGLQSSVVHNCFHTLCDKGLISYVKKGKIKHYKATDPKHFVDFIDEKKKNFEKLLPKLLLKQQLALEKNEAEVYEGYKGVMSMLLAFIENTKPGDEFLFFSADVAPINKEIQDFYKRYDPKRKAKKLKVRGLADKRLKKLFGERVEKRFMKMGYTNGPVLPNTAICGDKLALITWGERPFGFLLHSPQLADKYRCYFKSVWKSLK